MAELAPAEPPKVDLTAILLDTAGLSDAELEALVLQYYQDVYLDNAYKGVRQTHDGQPVLFNKSVCTHHAFHKSVVDHKDCICPLRVQRVLWIRAFIDGHVSKSECWSVPEGDLNKRIYCYFDPPFEYVIWLRPRKEGGFKFETAYPANTATIYRYTHRQGAYLIKRF